MSHGYYTIATTIVVANGWEWSTSRRIHLYFNFYSTRRTIMSANVHVAGFLNYGGEDITKSRNPIYLDR